MSKTTLIFFLFLLTSSFSCRGPITPPRAIESKWSEIKNPIWENAPAALVNLDFNATEVVDLGGRRFKVRSSEVLLHPFFLVGCPAFQEAFAVFEKHGDWYLSWNNKSKYWFWWKFPGDPLSVSCPPNPFREVNKELITRLRYSIKLQKKGNLFSGETRVDPYSALRFTANITTIHTAPNDLSSIQSLPSEFDWGLLCSIDGDWVEIIPGFQSRSIFVYDSCEWRTIWQPKYRGWVRWRENGLISGTKVILAR